MTSMSKPNLAPALIDFVDAVRGPSKVDFRGGSIAVVAAHVYGDGIRIEWRMQPPPDLLWMDKVPFDVDSLPVNFQQPNLQLAIDTYVRQDGHWRAGRQPTRVKQPLDK